MRVARALQCVLAGPGGAGGLKGRQAREGRRRRGGGCVGVQLGRAVPYTRTHEHTRAHNVEHANMQNTLTHTHTIPPKVDVIYALSQAWCKSKADGDFTVSTPGGREVADTYRVAGCIMLPSCTSPCPAWPHSPPHATRHSCTCHDPTPLRIRIQILEKYLTDLKPEELILVGRG